MDNTPIEPGSSAEQADKALPKPCDEEPFPFMDLPKDIRLMVYERIPRVIKHHMITDDKDPDFVIISRSMPLAILRVSKAVHNEAGNIVLKIARTFVLNGPIQVVVSLARGCSNSFGRRYLMEVCRLVDAGGSLTPPLYNTSRLFWARENEKFLILTEFELRKSYADYIVESIVESLPTRLRAHVLHAAYQLVHGSACEIQVVISCPSKYQQTIASASGNHLPVDSQHLEAIFKSLENVVHYILRGTQIKCSCIGMTFRKDRFDPLDLYSVPQSLRDFGVLERFLKTHSFGTSSSDPSLMNKDIWVDEWLESSSQEVPQIMSLGEFHEKQEFERVKRYRISRLVEILSKGKEEEL